MRMYADLAGGELGPGPGLGLERPVVTFDAR